MSNNKIIGGSLLVAGTSIGATMLVLPLLAYKLGFTLTILIMFITAFVACYVGNMSVNIFDELDLRCNMSQIAGKVLGKNYEIISSSAMLLLLYSLITAYFSGCSTILNYLIPIKFNFTIGIAIFSFMNLIFSLKFIDYSNRILFIMKVVIFSFIIVKLCAHSQFNSWNYTPVYDKELLNVLSLFITSFGFHASLPYLYRYMDYNTAHTKLAINYGIIITLTIYVIWIVSVLIHVKSIQLNISKNQDIGLFLSLLSGEDVLMPRLIRLFSILAILTSLIGVSLGLFEFLMHYVKFNTAVISDRIKGGILVFIPPLIFNLIDVNIFIKALTIAGTTLTILAVIIPSMIKLKISTDKQLITYLILIFGILTIVTELLYLIN
jgi:tyrosine-specific transport protein